ncbi:PREDICTED: nurim homolog [Nicrophorus vespilloides]|uniref:Nuclear envelope membrane protein n=1 Tax=Nicrophorus vespilloides TaxID=110193 RepID=A0ABM1M185_NICVS|nr:PREDICTED: nurim homolog [Nicrophorus vespilloides]
MWGAGSICKISVASAGVLATFYTVIDLMLFISYPNYHEKEIKTDVTWHDLSWPCLKNMFLLTLFIYQHTFMAMQSVKDFFERFNLKDIQRSIYIISTCVVLLIMTHYWEHVPEYVLWKTDNGRVYYALMLMHALAWLIIYSDCIYMDINELLGLKQVYYSIQNLPDPMSYKSYELQKLYLHMRHQGFFVAFLLIFWAIPVMSLDRFHLAVILSFYLYLVRGTDDRDYTYLRDQHKRKFH